jgi:hypothetical protein
MRIKIMKEGEIIIAIVFITAVALTVLDRQYEHDKLAERNLYCEMVQLWEANKQLPPAQRPGWPPYKGREVCNGTTTR